MLLHALCILLLSFATLVCAYYLFLAAIAWWLQKLPPLPGSARHRFAIVIPAHDEEKVIAGVLRSCAQLDYPADQIRVHVIADNCTDGTARLARQLGASCHERRDRTRTGKGAALEWGIARILAADAADAVVIVDADCRLDRHALRTFDAHLSAGAQVLQANDVASNPDESAISYVAAVANYLENDLFYAPKSRLGLSVTLRGTGMVFHRSVLEQHPMREASAVEDSAYSVRLLEAGIRVRFVPEVRVSSAFPAGRRELVSQRTRWIGGNVLLSVRHALRLMGKGCMATQPAVVDHGWTMIVCMRSWMALELLAAALLSVSLVALTSARGVLIAWSLGLVGFWVGYFLLGAFGLGLNRKRLALLRSCPAIVLDLLLAAALAPFRTRLQGWQPVARGGAGRV